MVSEKRLRGNVALIRVINFTWMFLLIMPVAVPFFGELGLSLEEIFQVQALFGLTVVVLEVPTGYLSDWVGRKGCLILAGALHGAAFSLLPFADGFRDVVVFEVLAAVGTCFYSGTDVALLYDSLEGLEEKGNRRRDLGKLLFWKQAGETCAALIGGWIALVSLHEVAVWSAVVGWMPFVAALGLVEVVRPGAHPAGHAQNIKRIWHELFVESPIVRRVLLNLMAYGLSTLLAVWAFQDYWRVMGVSLVAFGYLWAAYNLTVAVVGRLAHRIEARFGLAATIRSIAILPVIGYFGMAAMATANPHVAATWIGVMLGFLFQVGRGLTQVVLRDELNSRVRGNMRATANSISSVGVRLGYALLGPLLATLIEGPGYPVAFSFAGGVYLLIGAVLAWPLAASAEALQKL